ncbi:unnamed protein product [[Candida] boidinii]|uniref:Unnamed protein product n=1 Tax=Candida boidinii TaxID=5477 RepID=A0A9W6SWN1_CANBO|nr:unnamed protein product [[Candida] boidinii]GMF99965.1 unnamed protein product [[Candida] boidinii]
MDESQKMIYKFSIKKGKITKPSIVNAGNNSTLYKKIQFHNIIRNDVVGSGISAGDSHPKRSKNKFMIARKTLGMTLQGDSYKSICDVSKIVSAIWKSRSSVFNDYFQYLAEEEEKRIDGNNPNFQFSYLEPISVSKKAKGAGNIDVEEKYIFHKGKEQMTKGGQRIGNISKWRESYPFSKAKGKLVFSKDTHHLVVKKYNGKSNKGSIEDVFILPDTISS